MREDVRRQVCVLCVHPIRVLQPKPTSSGPIFAYVCLSTHAPPHPQSRRRHCRHHRHLGTSHDCDRRRSQRRITHVSLSKSLEPPRPLSRRLAYCAGGTPNHIDKGRPHFHFGARLPLFWHRISGRSAVVLREGRSHIGCACTSTNTVVPRPAQQKNGICHYYRPSIM